MSMQENPRSVDKYCLWTDQSKHHRWSSRLFRYLTGRITARTLEKYQIEARKQNRESWFLSWALDTNEEERERGKTVEVGRGWFETEKKHFIILDAPGHQCYVPNMIGAATQADLAILVRLSTLIQWRKCIQYSVDLGHFSTKKWIWDGFRRWRTNSWTRHSRQNSWCETFNGSDQ